MFPIDSTTITLTSKLLWEKGWHQVKLFSGLNSITTTVEGIVSHFGQDHDSKEGEKTVEAIPVNGAGAMDRGFASRLRTIKLLEEKDQHFRDLRINKLPSRLEKQLVTPTLNYGN